MRRASIKHRLPSQRSNGKSGMDNAYERFVLAIRADPAQRPIALGSFLEEDFEQAVARYSQSEEFTLCWNLLRPYVRGGCRFLDLGAGRGLTSVAFARQGVDVTSVEYDPSDVVGVGAFASFQAKSGLPLRAIRGNALQLPFRGSTFDLVFCRSVLHHLDDLGRGLQEIWRVLKPGGVFLAYNEHVRGLFSDGSRFLKAHPAVPYGVNEWAYPILTYWWKLRAAGFRRAGFFQYQFVLEFSDFLKRAKRRPSVARWIGLPGIGGVFARLLYDAHFLLRRLPRYLVVAEEQIPAISILAHKPSRTRERKLPGPSES